jgi:uncharacterized membrane protein YedE/YeeE
MYCPSCGTEVTKELNYCNRCGANLNLSSNSVDQPLRPVNLTGPTIAIALMVVIGLGIVFASVSELARKEIHPAALTWMVLGGLAMITAVTALVLRQWGILAGAAKQRERTFPRKKAAEKEAAPMSLPPMRSEPIQSVTDHTTRTFDPVYREPVERRK